MLKKIKKIGLIKKTGLTMIETLFAVGVASGASVLAMKAHTDDVLLENDKLYAVDINNIISAVDQRIALDGYDINKWTNKSWNASNIEVLFNEDLQAINSKCGSGNWTPSFGDDDLSLVNCNFMAKKPFDMDISAELIPDTHDYIKQFSLKYKFKSDDDFIKNYSNIKYIFKKAKLNNGSNTKGVVKFYSINDTNGSDVSILECVDLKSDCAFVAVLDRLGGNEYLQTDGLNSMINSKVTFIESKTLTDPLKCIRWENDNDDGTGAWERKVDESCGIGIYENTNSLFMVDVAAQNGTFQNVLLDKECDVYQWNGTTVDVAPNRSPCGITKDGTSIIQVVDNISANVTNVKTANVDVLNGEEGFIEYLTVRVAKISEIISPVINAEFVNITNELRVQGIMNVYALTNFYNATTFKEDTLFEKSLYVNDDLQVINDSSLGGDLKVDGNTTTAGKITSTNGSSDSIKTSGGIISEKIGQFSELYVTLNASENGVCSPNGKIAKKSDGTLLNCVSGRWTGAIGGTQDSTIYSLGTQSGYYNYYNSHSVPIFMTIRGGSGTGCGNNVNAYDIAASIDSHQVARSTRNNNDYSATTTISLILPSKKRVYLSSRPYKCGSGRYSITYVKM